MDAEPNAGDDSDSGDRSEAPGAGDCESNSEIDFTEESEDDSSGEDGHERKGVGGRKRAPSKLIIKAARARRARRGASSVDKHINAAGSGNSGKA